MTKIYAELYEGTTLYAIPERYVQRASYLSLQHHLRTSDPDRTYLTTFGGFANVSAPNYTVGIDYAQSLLCVKGLSASKVVDVIQQWPTPYALYTDLDRVRAETEIERVEFDRKLAAGKLPKIRANAKHKPPTADGYIKSKARQRWLCDRTDDWTGRSRFDTRDQGQPVQAAVRALHDQRLPHDRRQPEEGRGQGQEGRGRFEFRRRVIGALPASSCTLAPWTMFMYTWADQGIQIRTSPSACARQDLRRRTPRP